MPSLAIHNAPKARVDVDEDVCDSWQDDIIVLTCNMKWRFDMAYVEHGTYSDA